MVRIRVSAGGGGFLKRMVGNLFRRARGRGRADRGVDGMPPPGARRTQGGGGTGREQEVRDALAGVNPKGHKGNCVNCAIVYELRRRGFDVSAGRLPSSKRAMHSPDEVNKVFGRDMAPASRDEIVRALQEAGDGARGIVRVDYKGGGSGHAFNVENVGGQVRFVDGQPPGGNPGASYILNDAKKIEWARVDDAPNPDWNTYRHYIEYDPRDLLR